MGRLWKVLALLAIVLAVLYGWLLDSTGPATVAPQKLDLAVLRREANAMPGAKPTALEYAAVASRTVPGAVIAAGTGLRQVCVAAIAWKVVAPGGDIVIDTAMSRADAQDMGFNTFDPAASRTVQGWIDSAALILLTHGHIDHVGGYLDHPRFRAVADKALITPGLKRGITSLWRENARYLPASRPLAPIQAVAPGVVAIQTPGHTPASQMFFVTLQSGREYLFAGDTASMFANVQRPTPRARLMTDWLAPEDRRAVIGWLKAIKPMTEARKPVTVIPSHDIDWIDATADEEDYVRAPLPGAVPKRHGARAGAVHGRNFGSVQGK